jgi:hypothetical protein
MASAGKPDQSVPKLINSTGAETVTAVDDRTQSGLTLTTVRPGRDPHIADCVGKARRDRSGGRPRGSVRSKGRTQLTVDRTSLTTRSIEFDAVVVAGGTAPSGDIELMLVLQETYRHCQALAAWVGRKRC